MKSKDTPPTKEFIEQLISYDPETGLFSSKNTYNPSKLGRKVGYVNKVNGYMYWGHKGKFYLLHRLAWLLMTGEWPEHEVDHVDRDKTNQRWSNLRAATRQDNMCNSLRTTELGVKGVYKRGNRFIAQITRNRKPMYLGAYATAKEAQIAYALMADALHGEYARVA